MKQQHALSTTSGRVVLSGVLVPAFAALLVVTNEPSLAQPNRSPQSPCPAEWTLAADLTYDDSPSPLMIVRDLLVTRSGRVIVSETDGNTLKVFDANGRFATALGRTGEGPGEFRTVSSALALGDSIWVFDDELMRGTVFGPQGNVAGTVNLGAFVNSYTYGSAFPLTDRFVLLAPMMTDELTAPGGFRRAIALLDTRSKATSPLAAPLLMRGMLAPLTLPGGSRTAFPLPTPRADWLIVLPGGRTVVIVRGVVIEQTGRRFVNVTKLGPRADTVFSRRIEVERAPVDRTWLDEKFKSTVRVQARWFPSEAAAERAVRAVWSVTPHFSPFSRVFADNDGRIWLQTNPPRNRWLVLDSAGTPVACVTVAPNVRVSAAAGTSAWGVVVDADDVNTIQRFRIRLAPQRDAKRFVERYVPAALFDP